MKKITINNPQTKKILKNIYWLFIDKVLRMAVGVFVVILFARYVGPSDFGLFSYITALVSLFSAVFGLGLNAIVTRDLVLRDDKEKILGTAFVLKLVSGLVAYLFLIVSVYLLRSDEPIAKFLAFAIGLSLIFKPSEVIKYWFQAKVESKAVVIVENVIFSMFTAIKLLAIYLELSLIYFGLFISLEALIGLLGLLYIYSKTGGFLRKWAFKLEEAKSLLKQSWPLIISSTAWIIYTKIDQIMIGQMLSDKEVGFYSAVSRLSETTNFLPTIITFSIVPAILKLKDVNRELYNHRFQQLYYLIITLMLVLAILVTTLSEIIINILYGASYLPASKTFSIHIWSVIFTSLAVISGRYLVNDGLQKFTMWRHLTGVALNIPLNYIMIPKYGIEGAALASLGALIFANYTFDCFSAQTRFVFYQKTNALFLIWMFRKDKYNKTGPFI